MENGAGVRLRRGVGHHLGDWWFALRRRKIRTLAAGTVTMKGPALFAVSHPAGFLPALILAVGLERPARCLVPGRLVRGSLAHFLARQLGFILYDGEGPAAEATLQEAVDVLAHGGALVVFTN